MASLPPPAAALGLTIDEAAGRMGISKRTLRRRIDAGQIHPFRDGRIVRITEAEIRRYCAAHIASPTATGSAARPARRGRPVAPGSRLWD